MENVEAFTYISSKLTSDASSKIKEIMRINHSKSNVNKNKGMLVSNAHTTKLGTEKTDVKKIHSSGL